MIVSKIDNPKKSSGKAARVAGVVDYITEPEKENSVEKCIYYEAVNFLSDDLHSQKAEMTALAQEAVRSKDPIDHWVLSWKSHERPTPEQAREAAAIFIKQCGLEGHQYVLGLHDDTDNMHMHIGVNRVHPDTGKVVKINKGFDLEAGHQAIAIIEKVQGWSAEENARYRTNDRAELVIDPATKRPQIFENKDKQQQPSSKSQAMEIQTGQKSAQRIGIENAAPIIAQATTWKELHAAMAEAGMQYQRKGSGAVVQVGNEFVKASSITPKASLSALQKRFGPYQPPQEIKPHEYHNHTAKAKEPHPAALGKIPGNHLRNLSKCDLAHSEKNAKASRPRVLHLDVRADRRVAGGLRREAGRAKSAGLNTPQPLRENQPGWNEYIAIRDAQRAEKIPATIEQQKRHDAERTALAAKQKAERDDLFKGNWKGKGEAKNLLKSLTATQQAAEKLELQERHREERKALQAQYKPLPMYKQWREQPQIVGMKVLPLIDQHITRDKQVTVSQTLRALSHTVDARKHITYQLDRKNVFRDEGKTIAILDLNSDRGIAAALATAQQKFGQTLELTGSDAFKRNAVAVAVANNLTCKFSDPELDKLREQLQAVQYQAVRDAARAVLTPAPLAPIHPSTTREAVPPAPARPTLTTAELADLAKAQKKATREAKAQAEREAAAQKETPDAGHQTFDPTPQAAPKADEEMDMSGLVTDRERDLVQRIHEAIKTDNGPEMDACMDALASVRNEAKKALVAVSPQEVNKAAIAHQVKQEQNAAAKKRGDPEPWGFDGKTNHCSWDRPAKEAAEERDAHLKTQRPMGMFKGAEGKAWDERSAQLESRAAGWEKAASSIKKELSVTTDQRVAKEAQTVAASNAKNAPQRAQQQQRVEALARVEKRLETALAPHRERQRQRDDHGTDFGL